MYSNSTWKLDLVQVVQRTHSKGQKRKQQSTWKWGRILMFGPQFSGILLPGPDITGSYGQSYGLLDTPLNKMWGYVAVF